MQIFEESLFFKLRTTIQQKTVKPTCVRLMLGGCREEKGQRLGGWREEKGQFVSDGLFEVCLADTEGSLKVGSYDDANEREQESKQGFELLEW